MQVNRPSNIPGYGQGPGAAERSNRDGQRKNQGGKDEPKKQPPDATDAVELHSPNDGKPPSVKPVAPVKPAGQSPGKKPPLDLSA